MKTQAEQLQEIAEAQTKLRAMVVAAGILTEQDAERFMFVRLANRATLPPGVHVPTCCEGCGHDMDDALLMEIGISKSEIGEEKVHAILALLQATGAEN